ISRDDYHRVSTYVTERKVKEGVALLELGLLEPKSLFLALKEQVRARLVECFGWPRGSYDFAREETPPEGAQPFRADLLALIEEGIETHWNAERVLADLAPRMNQVVARNARFAGIEPRLRSDESVVGFLAALDGTRTLWSALQHARTPRAMAAAWLADAMRAVDYGTGEREKP